MYSVITNNQIKFVKSLHQSKFRQKYNNFIAEGDKIAQEILQISTYKIVHVFALQKWMDENANILRKYAEITVSISKLEMAKISILKTSSPVLIVLEKKNQSLDKIEDSKVIYLDNVQDPGNVGTIIRIADWFGIKTIIRNSGTADFYHPKVVQATMGSFLGSKLYTSDFDKIDFSNHKTVGAVMHGTKLGEFKWPENTVLVMGNEGKGISAAVHQTIDHHVTIEGSDDRVADSLNVSMATGILCASLTQ